MSHAYPDTQLLIDGQWVDAASGKKIAVHNPATGAVIGHVAHAGIADLDRALAAAQKGFQVWKRTSAHERQAVMRRAAVLLQERADAIAAVLTQEQGKPLAEAKGEIAYGASFVEWFSEEGKRVYGETIPAPGPDKRIVVIKQPVGVVTAITPWNFPSSMITRKAAAALAVGCTFVVRPASATPLSALALARLTEMAGFPPGVFNVIPSKESGPIGKVFTESPKVAKFSFTGSTEVGKKLIAQCAATVKRVSMELGGNAPFVVFDDADLDAAVAGALASKYRNAGQTCVCANRFLVQRPVQDAFAEKLARAVATFKVGNGMEAGVDIGPLINEQAVVEVERLVQASLAAGAQLVAGGKRHNLGGCFYEPTILKNVSNDMPIAANEIFGPVAPLITFDTEEEALQLANDSSYGLAAYFYARDIGRVWRVAEALEYGMVGINEGIISNAAAPFGGVKQSGLGREGSHFGMDEYLEIKYLCLGGLD